MWFKILNILVCVRAHTCVCESRVNIFILFILHYRQVLNEELHYELTRHTSDL